MAVGLTRSEQTALIATILLIVGGLAWQELGSGSGEGVWIESEPGWRPVALSSPAPPAEAPRSLGSPAQASTSALPTRLEAALASADAAPIVATAVPDSAAPPAPTSSSASPTANEPVASGAVAAIDLNKASAAELDRLPGIGPAKAAAIVEHRQRLGLFASLEDFLQVKGIGPSDIEKIRPYIVPLPERAAPPTPAPTPAPAQPLAAASPRAPTRVNINTATSEQLQTLPGIGPVLADRIIAARRVRPFRRPEDLLAVRGIGERTFAKMRALVTAP